MNEPDPSDVTQDHRSVSVPPDEDFSLELPERIGRYRIEKLLGKGGFGMVYLARDEQLDRPVAVKVPHAKLVSRPEDAELYLAEARTVASLEHPNIIPVHDVGSAPEFPCFVVSRFVAASDLATHLKQTRLSYADAAGLVATVAEALHYAHKRGIVHRDVKPGNRACKKSCVKRWNWIIPKPFRLRRLTHGSGIEKEDGSTCSRDCHSSDDAGRPQWTDANADEIGPRIPARRDSIRS